MDIDAIAEIMNVVDIEIAGFLRLPCWLRRGCQEVRNLGKAFCMFGLCFYKKLLSSRYDAGTRSGDRQILITSLFYPSSFSGGCYVDPFFGSLHSNMDRDGWSVTYLCHALGHFRRYRRSVEEAKNCGKPRVLLPYALVTWAEMILLALKVLVRRVPVPNAEFMGCYFSRLIKWNARRFDHFFNLGAEIFYLATKKLCQHEKLARLLQLYEGNVFERGCIQAFAQYGKGDVVGYSQAVVFAQNLKIRVTDKERERRPEPSFLICTGPENARLMIRLGNRIPTKVKLGCSLRYVPVADGRAAQSTTKSNILVALDGVWSSVSILDWLLEHAEVFADYQVTIRAHPNVPLNRLLEQCLNGKLPANYHESQDTLKEDIGKSFCTIYRQSSVGLQAILNGVPVIHLNVDAPLESDPINGLKALKWAVRTPGELVRALREIRELDPAQRSQQVNEAQEYARRYFAPPNDENIMPFYADV
jgi:hypothetical protein